MHPDYRDSSAQMTRVRNDKAQKLKQPEDRPSFGSDLSSARIQDQWLLRCARGSLPVRENRCLALLYEGPPSDGEAALARRFGCALRVCQFRLRLFLDRHRVRAFGTPVVRRWDGLVRAERCHRRHSALGFRRSAFGPSPFWFSQPTTWRYPNRLSSSGLAGENVGWPNAECQMPSAHSHHHD